MFGVICFNKFFLQKNHFWQKFVCPKKFWPQFFFAIFWANYFFSKKNFWQKFSFSRYFLFSAKYLFFFQKFYSEIFLAKNLFGKSFLGNFIFGRNFCWVKFFLIIFFWQNFYKCHCDCWVYVQSLVKIGSVTDEILVKLFSLKLKLNTKITLDHPPTTHPQQTF